MQVESFMKAEAQGNVLQGGSTDAGHADEVELLSFDHSLDRSPIRGQNRQFNDLERLRSAIAAERAPGVLTRDRASVVDRAEAVETATTASLASHLTHQPVTILKVVNKSSPLLASWATREYLASVTLSLRTISTKDGKKHESPDLLQVHLEDAFICEMEVVGSYPEQPWLGDLSPALWQSTPHLNVGPVERIRMAYQKITWSVNGKHVFGWDVAAKKQYTRSAS